MQPRKTIDVLLVEDDEDDYLITREMLASQQRARYSLEWCSSYEDGLARIGEQRHHVYLVDYRLGSHTGLELVRDGFAQRPRAPVIMLTGETDYEIDLEATAAGVTDFLVKQKLDATVLERSIRYAISQHSAVRDLALSEERYALAVRAASDGIWDWDLDHDCLYLSPRWHEILGLTDVGAMHALSKWFDLVHHDDLLALRAAMDAHIAGRTPHFHSEHRIRHADGSWRWVLSRGLVIRDQNGTPTRMAGSMSDITDRRTAEHQLQHEALHDSLTGLPNRALFMDRVHQILQRAVRDPTAGCAVLFLDIDRFKLVNDSLSHGIGDRLLMATAGRLSSVLRPGDTVARFGGDEFTLLLDGVVGDEGAITVADRVLRALAQPFSIDGHQLFMTASVGIALGSANSTGAELIRNADIAMYDAKRRGRSRCAVFDESMHRQVVHRLARENELREAIETRIMPIHYQPIVDLASGSICAFEALARWPAEWDEVEPLEFIPIAEETGVIGELGMHVLRTALDDLGSWRAAGLVSDSVYMSVNVSGRQLEDPSLPSQVRAAIAASGVPAGALRLEITESTLMQEPDAIDRIISEMCDVGVGLQLDDFGTGYSSLAALHQYPVDALKIDRSFISSLKGNGSDGDVIVRSTVALGHSLGLRVIAEGIEHAHQLGRLRTLGCEYGQGFLFSPPISAEQTEMLLASWRPDTVPV